MAVSSRKLGRHYPQLQNYWLTSESGLTDVVKVTVHLADLARDFSGFDKAYAVAFGDHRPVRTTVGSELSGILVEIDVVAIATGGASRGEADARPA